MEFADELYVGRSIKKVSTVVQILADGDIPHGVFCVCKRENGKYLYEIMSCQELMRSETRSLKYKVLGLAVGKIEAYEVARSILEDVYERI